MPMCLSMKIIQWAAMTIFRSFGEESLLAISSTSMFRLLIGTHQGTLWTKLTRAVSPSSATFSSRRYLRWRRSFHNDGSDARLAAKSQLTGLPEKSVLAPRRRARIGHAFSARLHAGGGVPGLFSLTVPTENATRRECLQNQRLARKMKPRDPADRG